jgi:hypothetical protein
MAPRPRSPEVDEAVRHERLTLIEFIWNHGSGTQPVLLASRELLH